jgi:uncharacterized membrane protein
VIGLFTVPVAGADIGGGTQDQGDPATGAVTETTTGQPTPDGDGNAWILLVATVVAAGGVVALLWANRRYGLTDGTATNASEDGKSPAAETESADKVDSGAESNSDETGDDDESDATPPSELPSNEEQVLHLLNKEGGRVKQQQIASQLDWTAARTSQVIGSLRDEERLETFRIGQENVVMLPGVDIVRDVGADDTDDTEDESDESSDRQ